MSPRAKLEISSNAQPQNGWGFVAHSVGEIQANHAQLVKRNAYHRRFGYDPEASVAFVLEKALPLRGRVLDVGTGKGRFVIALARHVANVTTVDISAEEQRFARLEAVHAGVAERIQFVKADARGLPWSAASFDAVVTWNVFHHLADPGRVFAEMVRVLNPAGKLVLADFSIGGFRRMNDIHESEGRRHPHPPNRFAHWAARLQACGFAVRGFTGCNQQVLVAGPAPRTSPSPIWFSEANGRRL
jgi:SAM-dependent methyltransferase